MHNDSRKPHRIWGLAGAERGAFHDAESRAECRIANNEQMLVETNTFLLSVVDGNHSSAPRLFQCTPWWSFLSPSLIVSWWSEEKWQKCPILGLEREKRKKERKMYEKKWERHNPPPHIQEKEMKLDHSAVLVTLNRFWDVKVSQSLWYQANDVECRQFE